MFSLADDVDIDPCIACDYCTLGDGCIIDDAMQDVYDMLDEADSLTIVSPVYFAGPPAQLKALLDRLQRYYNESYVKGVRPEVKIPAELFVLGDGGDPHGIDPLAAIVRSSLAVAGYGLEQVHACIGFDHDALHASAQAWSPNGVASACEDTPVDESAQADEIALPNRNAHACGCAHTDGGTR